MWQLRDFVRAAGNIGMRPDRPGMDQQRRRMRGSLGLAALASIGAIAALSLWLASGDDAPEGVRGAEPPRVVAAPAVVPPAVPSVTPAPDAAKPVEPAPRTAAQDVEGFLREGSPEGQLAAFKVIQECVWNADSKRWIAALPPGPENDAIRAHAIDRSAIDKRCASLTQRQIYDRIQMLEKALAAQVPGAAVAFLQAGPNGQPEDIESRPDDLQVLAWKARSIEVQKAAAERGEKEAIASLALLYAGQYGFEGDLTQALAYEMTLRQIDPQPEGKGFTRMRDDYIASMQAKASPSELAEALRLKDALLQKCCTKK